jgi:hypothetical protein
MAGGKREVIRPDFDPIVITLDKNPDQCTQREGQYGVDYQYIVNSDSGIMWLPKAGRDALINSGARAGDQVELCKSQRGRVVNYVATLVSDARETRPSVTPSSSTAFGQRLQETVAAAPAQIPAPPASSEVFPIKEMWAACLRTAIDAMWEAREYAFKREFDLDGPSWEDVRALAITMYINRAGAK